MIYLSPGERNYSPFAGIFNFHLIFDGYERVRALMAREISRYERLCLYRVANTIYFEGKLSINKQTIFQFALDNYSCSEANKKQLHLN